MRRIRVSFVPLILAAVALLAMVALVQDRNIRTWAVVMGLTTVAAVSYGAYQEHVATRAIAVARRRIGGTPFDELRREMDRARRHERPFAVVRIRLGSGGTDGQSTETLVTALRAGDEARSALRSIDRWWRSANDLFLLLPETSADAARVALRRVGGDQAVLTGMWQVAAFPEDGITTGALFEALGARPPGGEDLPAALPGMPDAAEGKAPRHEHAAQAVSVSADDQ
jgi:hypothetical protein